MNARLAAGILLVAANAAAQNFVDVPERCGSQAEFEQELERLLGAEAAQVSPYALSIMPGEGEADYTLRLTLHGEQRELYDSDCRTLFKTAVVVAAASVRPELLPEKPAESAPPPAPPRAAPPPVVRSAARREESPSAPPPSPSAPWRASVGLGGGAIAGLVPDVAPLAEAIGAAERAGFGAELALRYVALRESEDRGGRGVEVRAYGGRAAALYAPLDFLRLSAGLEADLMVGRGTGVTTPMSDSAWSLAPSAELATIPIKLDRLRLELALQGRWAVVRPSFQISGFGEAYRVPSFGGAALIRAAYLLF